ncbi:MAG: serine/threonine protein kinase [Acidobacteria bacterium]|nr:serine/threonine protein kinase [Acidobacteriota bacterium]MYD69796.1 serine/threonine protein kinase [Acidobacteriota bacterium]MYJ03672.1 serine/threonine protein kinase [Acidobacteriota bacterium]
MSDSDTRDVVDDAIDAVTLNQDVQWERCARLATPVERRALDRLHRFTRLFRSSEATGPGSATSSAPLRFSSGFARRGVHILMALAAVELLFTLSLLPWHWDNYHQAHGEVAVFMTLLFASHGVSAVLLLWAGRDDQRTWLLGSYFLFRATVAPLHMLPAFWGQLPSAELLEASVLDVPAPARIFRLLFAYPLAFAVAPAFLWAFARQCPRIHRRTGLDDLARHMVPVSVALGCAICIALTLVYLAGTVTDAVNDSHYLAVLDVAIATPNVLSLAAVFVIALRARTAAADEVRRVILFSAAFLMWMGLATAYDVVEAFSPGFWLSNYQPGSVPQLVQPLRFPGMILLWYSVLAVRVPHPRELIRAGYRRLLLRPGLLGLAVTAPLFGLGWLLVSTPEREVGAVIADPLAQALVVAAGVMLLVVLGRERLLQRLDAWIDPATVDQAPVLAAAATSLARAERVAEIGRTVTRAVKHGCGSPSTLLVADEARHRFQGPDAAVAALPRTSAIAQMLETGGGALRVCPGNPESVFDLLPPDEAAWVLETAADVLAPVPGPGTQIVGIVLVGRRFDDRIVRAADVPFLEVVASATGQAVTRLQLQQGTQTRLPEVALALECPDCGCVTGGDELPACDCGAVYVVTEVPRLLAGKYRLTRRLGASGMSSVYLAWDFSLQRDVAVKTLGRLSESGLLTLKPEAWAMARVAHPALAEIHSVESWRGRPFLVVEFLRGGTLADRLCKGSIPGPEAVALTITLAEALGTLHEAGYLHGDVKPSNIGFTSNGLPKLLDFGLARGPNDLRVAGGTLRYLSPEVLEGRPADEPDDVWSLCVVLYEMVAGGHPFAANDVDGVVDRIRHQRVNSQARPASGSDASLRVATFAGWLLTAPRSARPTSARALADALREAPIA